MADETTLIEETRCFMEEWTLQKEKEKEEEESQEPDEDGWVTVSSNKRFKKDILEKVDDIKTNKKKKKKKNLVKLYAFQRKDENMEREFTKEFFIFIQVILELFKFQLNLKVLFI